MQLFRGNTYQDILMPNSFVREFLISKPSHGLLNLCQGEFSWAYLEPQNSDFNPTGKTGTPGTITIG